MQWASYADQDVLLDWTVISLYLLLNIAYYVVLGTAGIASSTLVAS